MRLTKISICFYNFLKTLKKLKTKSAKHMLCTHLVTPAGFEPATNGAEIRHSIQLNYGAQKRKTLLFFKPITFLQL